MPRETGVQSHVESYQRLRKWYLIPPGLALSIIRLWSRKKRIIWVRPPIHLSVAAIEKRAFGSPSISFSSHLTFSVSVLLNYKWSIHIIILTQIKLRSMPISFYQNDKISIRSLTVVYWPTTRPGCQSRKCPCVNNRWHPVEEYQNYNLDRGQVEWVQFVTPIRRWAWTITWRSAQEIQSVWRPDQLEMRCGKRKPAPSRGSP